MATQLQPPTSCVYAWREAPPKSVNTVLEDLRGRLEDLGAEPLGRWTVDIVQKNRQERKRAGEREEMRFGINYATPLLAKPSSAGYSFDRQLFIAKSDAPGVHCVVQERAEPAGKGGVSKPPEASTRMKDVRVGGDDLEAVLAKEAPFPTRVKAGVEGQAFALGDYRVRFGAWRRGESWGGVVLEVEYRPCSGLDDGISMVRALMSSVDPQKEFVQAAGPPDTAVSGPGESFSYANAALLYADCFNRLLR